jgi:hypothetical protein
MPDMREATGFTMIDGVEDAAQIAKLVAVLHGAQEVCVLNLVPALILFAGYSLLGELDLGPRTLPILFAEVL